MWIHVYFRASGPLTGWLGDQGAGDVMERNARQVQVPASVRGLHHAVHKRVHSHPDVYDAHGPELELRTHLGLVKTRYMGSLRNINMSSRQK